MRVCDELGVGTGEPDWLPLGPAAHAESCERVCIDGAMGGNEGEKMEGTRTSRLACGGMIWWFL